MKELEREILIIGAGPAGISAAIEAAKAGAKVTVADEHDTIAVSSISRSTNSSARPIIMPVCAALK